MSTSKNTKSNFFNPIKEEKDGVNARRVIWSTKSIELAITGLKEGRKLAANPFYNGQIKLLKSDLTFKRTEEEINEWIKCRDDIVYFVEEYCQIMTPQGIKKVTLRDYQYEYLNHLQTNQLSIFLACRQCGKSVTSALWMLHYLCFNVDKSALVTADKYKTAKEILSKAKDIFYELPYFLKPGINKWNESEIVLDNGCRLLCETTTAKTGIGFTYNAILADEFAKIDENIKEKFYGHLFPTVVASKAKFMITSTQNGRELFYRLYSAAKKGDNEYAPFEVTWDRVPEWNPEKQCWEKRDEAWHQKQVANYGSEEAFNLQFGTNFDISSNTLVSQKFIQSINLVKFVNKNLPGVLYNDSWYWHPDFDPTTLRNEYIVVTCDLAEGSGGDCTVFSLYRMIPKGLECVGYFRNNELPREQYAMAMLSLSNAWLDPNKHIISFEKNTYGDIFFASLKTLSEAYYPEWDWSVLVKYWKESGKYDMGIKITPGNKTPHCILFKESYELERTINESEEFVYELQNFCDSKGNGHFEASYGHDDMIMTAVQLEFVKKELQYKLLRESYEAENPLLNEEAYNPYEDIQFSRFDNIYEAIPKDIVNRYMI